MVGFLTGIFVLLVIAYFLILIVMAAPMYIADDEEETVTTTTTEKPHGMNIVGNLKRQYTEGATPQAFVIDPVDGQQTFINTKDDMYEDAAEKIWRLL